MTHLKTKILFLLFNFYFLLPSFAQDSAHLRISLLTCAPGEELYSTFGHSALRVVDSTNRTDIVYNYGTFNFGDDGFYIKFVRGKLMYYISEEPFEDNATSYGFKTQYQFENRKMTEQVLDLSAQEKTSIIRALNENLKEENKFYQYDFFLDNCTTRLRDLIVKNKQPYPQLPAVMPVNYRFRQAIHQYLDQNKKYWSKLGIDILLGAKCDGVMTTSQQQFLPDNLMYALDSTKNTKIVLSSASVYETSPEVTKSDWFTPMVFFSMLFFAFMLISFIPNKRVQLVLVGLDGLLFFFTGLLGILLIFMWFGTDHSMTKNNYNLLWAWPTHLIISFFINSRKAFAKKYFLITAVGSALVLLSWFFLPQQMNNALIPLVLLIIVRSVSRYRKS